MRKFWKILKRAERGATAIEYALIASLIGVTIITAVQTLGDQLKGSLNNIESELAAAAPSASSGP